MDCTIEGWLAIMSACVRLAGHPSSFFLQDINPPHPQLKVKKNSILACVLYP